MSNPLQNPTSTSFKTVAKEEKVRLQPTFALAETHAVDILDNALSVTKFLVDMAPHLAEDSYYLGLSEEGGHGLGLILEALHHTIETARDKWDSGRLKGVV